MRTGTAFGSQDHGGRDPEGGSGQIAVKKTDLAVSVAAEGRFAMKTVAKTLGVVRSNLIERLNGNAKPRRRYHKAQDAAGCSIDPGFGRKAPHLRLSTYYGDPEPLVTQRRSQVGQS